MYGPRTHANNHSNRNGRAAALGVGPRSVPPAWRHQSSGLAPQVEAGSKIFIAGLPTDVDKEQVQELMENTIGRLRDTFCVYNKAGKATGMAVVHFAKTGDAMRARMMYNNKIIDQRQPIKVDLIVDSTEGLGLPIIQAPAPPPPRTLLDRMTPVSRGGKGLSHAMSIQQQRALAVQAQATQSHPVASFRQRRKKGPRRLQKPGGFVKMAKTADDLDREMEEYRRTAPKTDVAQ